MVEAVKVNEFTGSSTAVLLKFDGDSSRLNTTNLGDSGYGIYSYVPLGIPEANIPHASKATRHESDNWNNANNYYFEQKFRSKDQ